MPFDLIVVIATTVAALVLFISEAVRVDLVAVLVMAVLLVSGVLTPAEGFAGFSNEATVTIAALFVLSEAFRRTGALNAAGEHLGKLFEVNEVLALMTMMTGVAVMSAFINNTAVVAVCMPLVISMSRRHGISPTRVLMPLSFAAMFGGLCTVIGTSSNLLVSSLLTEHGMEPISMFEMTVPGLIFFLVGTLYMVTFGRWLVPARGAQPDLAAQYDIDEYLAEVRLLPDCSECGRSVRDVRFGNHKKAGTVIGVVREDVELASLENLILQAGDILRIRGSLNEIHAIEKRDDILIQAPTRETTREFRAPNRELFEAVVAPDSILAGRTLDEVDFQEHFAADILAIRSRGQTYHSRLTRERLRGGDVLLMEAPVGEIARLQQSQAFVVVSELGQPELQTRQIIPVVGIMALVVGLAAFEILPIAVSAVAGAVLLVLWGVLDAEDAYHAIDWQVIFLLGGIIPLGLALEKTGGAALLASHLTGWLGSYGPLALLAGFYLLTTIMTDLMSNQATAILLTPIAIGAAATLGVDARVFVIAIAFGASASFATPVGYHTNTLIYGAGDYRFTDFVKVGLPLNLIFWAVAVFYLPGFWPF